MGGKDSVLRVEWVKVKRTKNIMPTCTRHIVKKMNVMC